MGRGVEWMLGVQKIIAVHYSQSTEIRVFPVHHCGRWFSAPQLCASLVSLAGISLVPMGPHGRVLLLGF